MRNQLSNLFLIISLLTLFSCDFTPTINKEIVEAQEFLLIQEYEKAITKYQKILKKNPDNELRVKIYYQLGEIFSTNLGQYNKAIEKFEKVKDLTEDPLFLVKAEERIGEISFSFSKNYKRSYKSYKKLSEFTPKLKRFDFYQFRLAISSLKLGFTSEAISHFESIQKKTSHKYFLESFYYLGLVHFQKRKWKLSLVYLKEYINRETNKEPSIQAKFLMANIYESMEELKLAYDLYYSLLGKYPNTKVIQNRLNSIYSRRIARKR